MPEIGEVARVVHYMKKNLVNRTIKTCEAFTDEIVYGKVPTGATTAQAFQEHVTGRKVTGAGQQGKYFYMTFDKPPHAVMHFGMTGWMKFDNEDTHYYKQAKEKDGKEPEEWPPKYMKFLLKCDTQDGKEAVEAAFVDARRLARIRLVECEASEIRKTSPLKENGPDPVIDKDILTAGWLGALMRKKHVPIKALLLDQANISGVGNWVADEVLYQARIHPEQYSNTFSDAEIRRLHDSLTTVCTLAVETLADSKQFPETWLMKYRWDKGKKDSNVLPNGEKIVHLKVGGRTSAIVPSVQKKTAAVAGDVDGAEDAEDADVAEKKPAKGRKRKAKADEDEESEEVMPTKTTKRGRKTQPRPEPAEEAADTKPAVMKGGRAETTKSENVEEGAGDTTNATPNKGSKTKKAKPEPTQDEDAEAGAEKEEITGAAPRSGRRGKKPHPLDPSIPEDHTAMETMDIKKAAAQDTKEKRQAMNGERTDFEKQAGLKKGKTGVLKAAGSRQGEKPTKAESEEKAKEQTAGTGGRRSTRSKA